MSDPGAVTIVDSRGKRCPLPVVDLARAWRALPDGSTVELWATDSAARYDVPAWAKMSSLEVITEDRGDYTAYRVSRPNPDLGAAGPPPADGGTAPD